MQIEAKESIVPCLPTCLVFPVAIATLHAGGNGAPRAKGCDII